MVSIRKNKDSLDIKRNIIIPPIGFNELTASKESLRLLRGLPIDRKKKKTLKAP